MNGAKEARRAKELGKGLYYGQPAPYPSLAVQARNGRVADNFRESRVASL